jgi:hypothetical protein
LHYCFEFTTRNELISDDWRDAFYKFIAGNVRALGGSFAAIGGTNQTVELRVILKPTFAPDLFAQRLKILSASWARRKAGRSNFAWLEDYDAITLDGAAQKHVARRIWANA